MAKVQLRTLAHSRTGDKGDMANLSLIPFDEANYDLLCKEVTAERVKNLFYGLCRGEVIRYEMPSVSALNFLLQDALGGGVTKSLALDLHGKAYSSLLLSLEIDMPD